MNERIWIMVSGILLLGAAFLLWRNNLSAAFVIAALGACAWFLSYRAQLREKLPRDEDLSEEPESDAAEQVKNEENED